MSAPPLTLEQLSAEQMAALEERIPEDFPDVWREFAESYFVTLVGKGFKPEQVAWLAVALARGNGRDLGGIQAHVPVFTRSDCFGFPSLLCDFAGSNRDTLLSMGISDNQAGALALGLARGIGHHLGGSGIYIPKGVKMNEAKRNAEIARDFPKMGAQKLAMKHGISISAVYRVIRNDMRARRAECARKVPGWVET